MSFAKKTVKPENIHFVSCRDNWGRPCHFFLLANQLQVKALKNDDLPEIFDLTKYGKIIASGFGKKPSKETREQLMAEYNYNFDKITQN